MTAPDGGPNKRIPERDRLLIDLGMQVRSLGEKVERVRCVTVDTVRTLAEFGPQLANVQGELAELRGTVNQLCASESKAKNAPVDWRGLSAEDAEQQWERLGCWVHEVLGGWYEITREQLPDCWALHRPALVQVSWLWISYIQAYLSDSHPNQAAEWNTRLIDAALGKIKAAIPASLCRAVAGRPGEHLVAALEAQQHRNRAPRQRVGQLVYTHTNTHPSPQPSYSYDPHPPPVLPATGEVTSPGRQVIHRPFWRGFFEEAMQADLAERRRGEAEQHTSGQGVESASDQLTGPDS
jgi:hypothetical protein